MAKRPRQVICRWKGCKRPAVPGKLLCAIHLQPPGPDARLPRWIRDLPLQIGIGLASNALYEAAKFVADNFPQTGPMVVFNERREVWAGGLASFIEAKDMPIETKRELILCIERGLLELAEDASEQSGSAQSSGGMMEM
jgi:hypothetical protein